jgi:hypothetical protein
VLGLKADLAPPLNAAGKLRNKFAHRLDMQLTAEVANNLIATLPPALKTRLQGHRSYALSELPNHILKSPALKAQFETLLGHPLPELANPFDLLKGEARAHAEARMDVIVFFLCLFEELAGRPSSVCS